MEQLINTMLANVKATVPVVRKGESSAQKEGFQKLLEQKQADAAPAPRPEKAETAEKPQEAQNTQKPQEAEQTQPAVQTAPEDGKVLEEQMTLAAMLMMQDPLAAEIVKEIPQAPADPNGGEGLVPVEGAGSEEGGLQMVSWMPQEAEGGEKPDGLDAAAPEWIEGQTQAEGEAEVLPKAQIEVPPEAEAKAESPVMEIKVESGRAETRDADTSEGEELPEPQGAEVEAPVFEEVKAVPVKVGEAPRAAETAETENIGEQIGPKLIEITSVTGEAGGQSVTIDLDPANLGKLQIEVGLSKDGTLYVHVNAENSRTQNLLSRNSESLAAILGKYTQQEVRVEVPRQEESQRQDLYEQQQQQNQHRRQEERRRQQSSGEDFLQQLRLGLIPMDGE